MFSIVISPSLMQFYICNSIQTKSIIAQIYQYIDIYIVVAWYTAHECQQCSCVEWMETRSRQRPTTIHDMNTAENNIY